MTHLVDIAANLPLTASQQDTGPAVVPVPTPSGSRPARPWTSRGPSPARRWFVVSTYAQAERRARQHLTEQGYEAYLPLITVSRRDRVTPTIMHRVEVPLFPAYLFCRFDALRDPWRPILNTLGVYDLIRKCDGTPNPCPEIVVSTLQAAEASRATPGPETGPWAPGTSCALGNGMPLGGLPAVVLDSTSDKVRIGVMFLGDVRIVSVPPECLVKLPNDEL